MSDCEGGRGSVVAVDGETLTLESVVRVARDAARAELAPSSKDRMDGCRSRLDRMVEDGATIYAVNTGVGDLVDVRIPHDDLRALQVNLLRSHACAVGDPLPVDVVRAMMLLRANALSKGYSAVRSELVELLLDMLNNRVHPVIPRQGSVGSSGDLALLAHLGLVLIGEGRAESGGGVEPGRAALSRKGLEPIALAPKEAISLINGTQAMSAMGVLAAVDASALADNAQIASAMSLEALRGTSAAFDPRISKVRPHEGQVHVSRNMLSLLDGSEIMQSHKHCSKVQDAYALRCTPQVIGASVDAIRYARKVLAVEVNSATDNPLFFPEDGEVISGGNFHGQPVALAMDFLSLASHELGSFSERRVARLVDHKLSGLPPFLTNSSGLSSGMMVPQYVAASLVSENKSLVHPASADSIPTSANQEDHNSMGTTAAWKARTIVENVRRVLAIEFITAAQGLDFIALHSSPAVESVKSILRAKVPRLDEDRSISDDIECVVAMIADGAFVRAAGSKCDFEPV